jgi:hypothetical protein
MTPTPTPRQKGFGVSPDLKQYLDSVPPVTPEQLDELKSAAESIDNPDQPSPPKCGDCRWKTEDPRGFWARSTRSIFCKKEHVYCSAARRVGTCGPTGKNFESKP